MRFITRSLFLFLITGVAISSAVAMEPSFKSEIFNYDDAPNARNLHVTLKGKNWHAAEVTEKDIPFYQQIFNKPDVMAKFGDGKVRTPESTEQRLRTSWLVRYQNGQPHGSLTVYNSESNERIGYAVAGAGDTPTVSEIAGAGLPEYWGKGIGTDVMKQIIEVWGPEVRRIGLGNGLDEKNDAKIIKAFRCFGDRELARFDATASPTNPCSWKILEKFNFMPAAFKVAHLEPTVDLDHKDFESPEKLEEHIVKLFDVSGVQPLKVGVRYRLIDPEGKLRTFSKHENYDRIKYHFERSVE